MNLATLLAVKTPEQKLAELLTALQTKGFVVDTWRPGDPSLTILEVLAQSLAEQSSHTAELAKGMLLSESKKDWLTLLAKEVFAVTRREAVSAVYNYRLSNPTGSPIVVNAGALWVGTSDGRKYQNTTGGTVLAGGTLVVSIRAESPGAAWNTAANTITIKHAGPAGLTGTNHETSPTTPGADEESDSALASRCLGRWATTATGGNSAALRAWALEASPLVTKLAILSSETPGHVRLIMSGQSAGVAPETVALVQGHVQERVPPIMTVDGASATTKAVNVTATAYVGTAYAAAYVAAATAELTSRIAALDIGATLYASEIIEALSVPTGTRNVVTSAVDIVAEPTELLVAGAFSLTVISV